MGSNSDRDPVQAAYGVSSHYLGQKGREYFTWQSAAGALNGEINSHKFAKYVASPAARFRWTLICDTRSDICPT